MTNMLDTVITTRIRLARNVRELPYGKGLTVTDERLYSVLFDGAQKAGVQVYGKNYEFLMLQKMDDLDCRVMLEKRLISHDLLAKRDSAALLLAKADNMSVMINEEDHFRIQAFRDGFDLDSAYVCADKFDNALSQNFELAYSPRFGYLSACPTNMGTGMRASVMMYLPALAMTKNLEGVLAASAKAGLTARGIYGEGSDATGFMYQLSNAMTLGRTEHEVLEQVKTAVTGIAEQELNARDYLFTTQQTEVKDKIYRTIANFKYAAIMDRKELLNGISLLKLGNFYEFIKIPYAVCNELIQAAEPASLQKLIGKALDEKGQNVARAALVRERLKKYDIAH